MYRKQNPPGPVASLHPILRLATGVQARLLRMGVCLGNRGGPGSCTLPTIGANRSPQECPHAGQHWVLDTQKSLPRCALHPWLQAMGSATKTWAWVQTPAQPDTQGSTGVSTPALGLGKVWSASRRRKRKKEANRTHLLGQFLLRPGPQLSPSRLRAPPAHPSLTALKPIHLPDSPSRTSPPPQQPPTFRNLYKRKVNQLVSIFSATDSVLGAQHGQKGA